jgi:hypothetical protein
MSTTGQAKKVTDDLIKLKEEVRVAIDRFSKTNHDKAKTDSLTILHDNFTSAFNKHVSILQQYANNFMQRGNRDVTNILEDLLGIEPPLQILFLFLHEKKPRVHDPADYKLYIKMSEDLTNWKANNKTSRIEKLIAKWERLKYK